jgi:hypothetical protein
MPDGPDSAAQTDEQDFSIPGQQDDESQPGPSSAPPGASAPVTASQNASTGPSSADSGPPRPNTTEDYEALHRDAKVSGRAMFLGNLLKTILSGATAGMASRPTPFGQAVKAGMGAQPEQQLQQAKVQTALSEADQAKLQTSITGMKALQYEYLLKRLPQDDQLKHMQAISDFKQNLIKEGATVEAEGEDEKAADAQAFHLNGTDPRATNHQGRFYSLPTMDKDGTPKFDTVFVPSKEVLQNDFKWTDGEGNEQTIPAGTQMSGALGKFVDAQNKSAQNQTKDQHKQLGDALKPNVPDTEIPQTVGWLENQKKQNTPLYQQNKNAVDAQINTLKAAHSQVHAEAQADKVAVAKALVPVKVDEASQKADLKHEWDNVYARNANGEMVATNRKTATEKGFTDIDDTVSKTDMASDRKTAPIIKDVRGKLQDYQTEIGKGDLSFSEAQRLREIESLNDQQFEAAFSGEAGTKGLGVGARVGIKPIIETVQKLFSDMDVNDLSDKAQTRLATYIAARSSALELQKAQTQSSRASREGLMLDLAQIPRPSINGRMANKQLDLLMKSIDRISENNPFAEDKTKKMLLEMTGPKS